METCPSPFGLCGRKGKTVKLEIFPLLPIEVNGRYMLDLDTRLACVHLDFVHRRARFHFDVPGCEDLIRPIFEQDCVQFSGGGQGGDGVRVIPACTKEALEVICSDKLPRLTLGARPMLARA